jgi:hypothetical protein
MASPGPRPSQRGAPKLKRHGSDAACYVGYLLKANSLNDLLQNHKSVLIKEKHHNLNIGTKVFLFEMNKKVDARWQCTGVATWAGSQSWDGEFMNTHAGQVAANECSETALLRGAMCKYVSVSETAAGFGYIFNDVCALSSVDALYVDASQRHRLGWFKFTAAHVRPEDSGTLYRLAAAASGVSSAGSAARTACAKDIDINNCNSFDFSFECPPCSTTLESFQERCLFNDIVIELNLLSEFGGHASQISHSLRSPCM